MQVLNNYVNFRQKSNMVVSKPSFPVFGMKQVSPDGVNQLEAMLREVRSYRQDLTEKVIPRLDLMEKTISAALGIEPQAVKGAEHLGDVFEKSGALSKSTPPVETAEALNPIERMQENARKKSPVFEEFAQVLVHQDCTQENVMSILRRMGGEGKPINIPKHERVDFLIQVIAAAKRLDEIEILKQVGSYATLKTKGDCLKNLTSEQAGDVHIEILNAASEMTYNKEFYNHVWGNTSYQWNIGKKIPLTIHANVFNCCLKNREYDKAARAYFYAMSKTENRGQDFDNFIDMTEMNRKAIDVVKKEGNQSLLASVIRANQNLDRAPLSTEQELETLIDKVSHREYSSLPSSQPVKNIIMRQLKESLEVQDKTEKTRSKISSLTSYISSVKDCYKELEPELLSKFFSYLADEKDSFHVPDIYKEIIEPEMENLAELCSVRSRPALFNLDSKAHIVEMNKKYIDYLIKGGNRFDSRNPNHYYSVFQANVGLPGVIEITPAQIKGLVKLVVNKAYRDHDRNVDIKELYKAAKERDFKNYPSVVKAVEEIEESKDYYTWF